MAMTPRKALPAGPARAPGLASAAVSALEWVPLAIVVNVLVLLGTLAGLVVLGLGPSLVAGATVARSHVRGDLPPVWSTFWRTWRAELAPGTMAYLPLLALLAMAWANLSVVAGGSLAWLLPLAWLMVGFLGVACAWLAPLRAYYSLSPLRAAFTALRMTLARPLPSVVLLLCVAAVLYVTSLWPILFLLVSVGAGVLLTTYVATRTFDDNEAKLAEPHAAHDTGLGLPSEPLRMK
jgi:uncharacterized membrane protein YesL